MNYWNNIGLTRKIVIFIGAMLIIIAALSMDALGTIGLLTRNSRAIKDSGDVSSLMLAREIDHLNWINSLQRYVFDPKQATLSIQDDPHKCGLGQWYYGSGRQEAIKKFPELEGELRKMEDSHATLHESATKIRRLREQGNTAEAAHIFNTVSVPNVQAVQAVLKNVSTIMTDKQADTLKSFESSASFSTKLAMGIIVFGVVIAILMGLLISRTITVPVVFLARFADTAAGGNLDESLDMKRGDEIGSLASSLQSLVANIKSMITKANDKTHEAEESSAKALEAMRAAEASQKAAERAKTEGMLVAAGQLEGVVAAIALASEQLSVQIVDSERGAAAQADRINETAAAMEEMTTTILDVTKSAEETSHFSSSTKEKAGEGATVVRKAVDGIHDIQTASIAMKTDISKLAEQAEAISNIMSMISDIADQTNLLALNAAIEAARAGEAGRGFAVVADEVRKLAEKTMISTTDVGRSVSGIQSSVDESIAQVEKVVELVRVVAEEAARSGEMLSEIETMADGTADRVRSIATASEEQSATCGEINRAIAEINTISTRTATGMNNANTAVSNLTTQVNELNTLISDMKKG